MLGALTDHFSLGRNTSHFVRLLSSSVKTSTDGSSATHRDADAETPATQVKLNALCMRIAKSGDPERDVMFDSDIDQRVARPQGGIADYWI